MNAVQYWVSKARRANIRAIWPRTPAEKGVARQRRVMFMEAARKAKAQV